MHNPSFKVQPVGLHSAFFKLAKQFDRLAKRLSPLKAMLKRLEDPVGSRANHRASSNFGAMPCVFMDLQRGRSARQLLMGEA